MCGIAGVFHLHPSDFVFGAEQTAVIIQRMTNTMVYRGPDDSGVWVAPGGRCGLGHRRLSIIDTSSLGHQPMQSPDGRYTIAFNGEIYNYQSIKRELIKDGVQFQSESDTEVLLHAFAKHKEAIIPRLDGMFAFAVFDAKLQKITLARDAFGEKPLYYSLRDGVCAFASEMHALTEVDGFSAEVDEDVLALYLLLQYVPAPYGLYNDVYKLLPGHYLELEPGKEARISCHFRFEPGVDVTDAPLSELADELEALLLESISSRLMSDVPLGAFLSGGVDSSTVVAIMAKGLGKEVQTFSLGAESPESEHYDARRIARYLGTHHRELLVTPDIPSLVGSIAQLLDEPNADSSCLPTYLLSQFTAEHVTVVLSGDGGDELFGGYGRYFSTLEECAADAGKTLAGQYLSDRILMHNSRHIAQLFCREPGAVGELLASWQHSLGNEGREALARLRQLDTYTYMPGAVLAKVDRMSMQHSIEVRCPFLNRAIAGFAEKLGTRHCYAGGMGKLVLKEVAARYLPRPWLERPKRGFSLPTALWPEAETKAALASLLRGPESVLGRFLPKPGIEAYVARQSADFSHFQVWAVLVLELWLRKHPVRLCRNGRSGLVDTRFTVSARMPSSQVA